MNKEELYNLAISNVHKYSLLNEIFAIRDERIQNEPKYDLIYVNGYISLNVLNRYVRFIDELVKYEDIDTINNLKQLKQEKDKLESNWKALKEWLLEKNLPTNETIITEWIKIFNVLNKMNELEGDK